MVARIWRVLVRVLLPPAMGGVAGVVLATWRFRLDAREITRTGEYVCGLVAIPYLTLGLVLGVAVGLAVSFVWLLRAQEL